MRTTKEKKPKKPRPIAWSHPATPACRVAIRELQAIRAQQSLLTKKAKLLQEMIIKEGGGQAHGIRACIRHQSPGTYHRVVHQKARDFVVFAPMPTQTP